MLMQLGDELTPLPESSKVESARVHGCQSTTYLKIELHDGKVSISGTSDAKISKGLLALLLLSFNGESPGAILTTPFTLPEKLNLPELLSPSRSQGLSAMHLHLKKAVIPFLKN